MSSGQQCSTVFDAVDPKIQSQCDIYTTLENPKKLLIMKAKHRENGKLPDSQVISSEKDTYKHYKTTFYISILLAVVTGILIQVIVSKLLTKNESLGNNLFSKPPRQQGLVRFPPDVSWFTSFENGRASSVDESHMLSENTISSHAALDARTIQKVKARLKAKGESLEKVGTLSLSVVVVIRSHIKYNLVLYNYIGMHWYMIDYGRV